MPEEARRVTAEQDRSPTTTVARRRNRLGPLGFVVGFGLVSMLGDVVYEGMRSVIGPYLATFGASAALVGVITGVGEAVALVLRLGTGQLSDRLRRQWGQSILGYVITVVAVPPLAVAHALWGAASLVIAERFGKAIRTPARDTMLAQAGSRLGQGWAFSLHEALDQTGALIGPLIVAGMVALSGGFRAGFAVLTIPAMLLVVVILTVRFAAPAPSRYEQPEETRPTSAAETAGERFPRRFWVYAAFAGLTMLGFATFAVLAYHLQVRHVIAPALIPVVYSAAMGADAVAALAFGRLYDRIGLRGLAVLPVLAAAVPFLSFTTSPALVWIGALVWGAAMGIHDSTMRAAIADLVPASRRGAGYGTFTAIYGLAWLAGSVAIGALYDVSLPAVWIFVVAAQALALAAFVPLGRSQPAT
ncbi:MAG: MFS transporter [Streptosporangiaceae bacterium]